MSDFIWCTRSFFVAFSLIYGDLSNINTTKIADYMVTEHCHGLHGYRTMYGYIVTEHCPSTII